ncbi:hypothetical protein GCM10010430_66640 [Kitasatospora cystarginea]|uniref:Uncharacterized protein n=1 Tax=Kitasatospora cystarginea TaxID=58350 RepID=A0ABP5RQQ4_9ACTN
MAELSLQHGELLSEHPGLCVPGRSSHMPKIYEISQKVLTHRTAQPPEPWNLTSTDPREPLLPPSGKE